MTPVRQQLNFRFTLFDGAINTLDVMLILRMIHAYYGKQVMIIWDRLSAHLSAQKYFEREHPDWFLFEYFPSYSPELNPVEQCWNQMKHVLMENYIATSVEQLQEKVWESASIINDDPKLLAEFFHHAKLRL